MIKKIILASAMTVALAPMMASASDLGSGCGLGTKVMKGKTGSFNHLLAGTTNAYTGNTFSLTSGTFGCDASKQVNNDLGREIFVAQNIDSISVDAAQGQGQYLNTLASIMGIEETDKSQFFALTQENYDNIFGAESASAGNVLASLDGVMQSNANFSKYVR